MRKPAFCICKNKCADQLQVLWIWKFSRDFYFVIFSFSNYSRVLKFASKHSCSRPFPWVEGRRSLYFMREIN